MWREIVHQRLDFLCAGGREKLSFECAPAKVLRFIQRSPCEHHKAAIVMKIVATGSFGNIRASAVGAAHNLPADGFPGKPVPAESNVSYIVRESSENFQTRRFSKFVLPINGKVADR